MRLVHTIDTSPNPNAVCALSPSSENCYLLYPSPSPSAASPFSNGPNSGASGGGGGMGLSAGGTGDVLVFDCLSLQVVNIVQAHKTPVTFVTTNSDGTLMATASEKGTVIRVFSLPDAQKIYQFRRGSYPARIHSISFNLVSTLLCVSSDQETVHIFRLVNSQGVPTHAVGGGGFVLGSTHHDQPSSSYG